jgi:hypothetical protein
LSIRPDEPGEYHVTFSSGALNMKPVKFAFLKRAFFNPVSTLTGSYILAHVESSRDGENKVGGNLIVIADCWKSIELEFFLGTARSRRQAIAKIDLIIRIFTTFRDALAKEIALIERAK